MYTVPLATVALASALLTGLAAAVVFPQPAFAQARVRAIPQKAAAGVLEMRAFPSAVLDGDPVRLGAGARIRDLDNRIVLPASLSGTHRVLYTKDGAGLINEVWLATEAEFRAAREKQP